MNRIRVVELFAGVGGFRVGLEQSSTSFQTVWANQWEPSRKKQYAYDCYVQRFSPQANCVNEDIEKVKGQVPEHDLLVGGFPCQDYSVARTGARGIEGKKGVLWWSIKSIIDEKKPRYVLLENVDRLLKSPASQRGRDFGIILRSFYDAGYAVEWRVINAADYGQPQRRRRVFIFAYKRDTAIYRRLTEQYNNKKAENNLYKWTQKDGFFASVFPLQNIRDFDKSCGACINESHYVDLVDVSNHFFARLYNSGVMINGNIFTEELQPVQVTIMPLRDIREKGPVDEKYFLNGSLEKWKYLKGPKKEPRTKPNGEKYFYTEGGMCFPDDLDKPSRTMLTSESSVNRSTHVIEDAQTSRLRLLTPVECERLNGFPDGWTDTGMPEKTRYFVMGNALVVPLIKMIGDGIQSLESPGLMVAL